MTTVATAPLFLSRLILDLRSRRVRSELAQPYEMHRTLMRAFPKAASTQHRARYEFGVLFRADVDEHCDGVIVYVQSGAQPDWSFLHRCDDYLLSDARTSCDCKNVADCYRKLRDGQVFSFRLRANPTKRIARVAPGSEGLKGKRVGLLREEEQVAWLIRKGREREKDVPGGFEILVREVRDLNGEVTRIPRLTVCHEGKQTGYKEKESKRLHELTNLAVRFDGLLRITNADAFRATLAAGIGSAKAFGFGLLSLAPANPS